MVKSFDSWDKMKTSDMSEQSAKGKQVIREGGKSKKIIFKVQSNTQFMIKTVNMNDIIDQSGNLTKTGAAALNNFFNSQMGMVNVFGKFDSKFFQEKFLVYDVERDTARTQKLQFTVVSRSEHPSVEAAIQYVSTQGLAAISAKDSALRDVIQSTEQKAKQEDIKIEEPEDDKDEGSAKGSTGTQSDAGGKFKYTMRTNGKTYLMEITLNGALDANVIGDTSPNGAISWDDPNIMWYTDADSKEQESKYSKWIDTGVPMYTDSQITNKNDVEFLTKIFTDEKFRRSEIEKYEEEFGTDEMSGGSIKRFLYYKDGDRIFNDEPSTSQAPGSDQTSTSPAPAGSQQVVPATQQQASPIQNSPQGGAGYFTGSASDFT